VPSRRSVASKGGAQSNGVASSRVQTKVHPSSEAVKSKVAVVLLVSAGGKVWSVV